MRLTHCLVVLGLLTVSAPALSQSEIQRRGTVAHGSANTAFPERVGQLTRGRVVQYDPQGRDMSAGYNLRTPEGRVTLTIYIYPPQERGAESDRVSICRREYDANVREISGVSQYRGLRQGAPMRPLLVPGTTPGLSHGTTFTFRTDYDEANQELRSSYRLYCFVGGDWLVKVRATAPVAVTEPDLEAAIDMLVRTGPWPGRLFGDTAASANGASRVR